MLLLLPAELGTPVLLVPLTVLFWDAGAGPRAVLLSPGPPLLLLAAEPAVVLAEKLLADVCGPGAEEVEEEDDWALGVEVPSTPGAATGVPDMPADNAEFVNNMAGNLQRKQRQVAA